MLIGYNCSKMFVILSDIKLGKTLIYYLNVCKDDPFVRPNIGFFVRTLSILMYRFDMKR